MSGKKTFTVFPIGIADGEKKVLRNIFKLSLYRPRSYKLYESPADGVPEIALVDTALAADEWSRFRDQHPEVPALMIAGGHDAKAGKKSIKRPFVASRVLSLMDELPFQGHPPIENRVAPNGASNDAIEQPKPQIGDVPSEASLLDGVHMALVVDDSLPIRKQMEIELKHLGVKADFAESGEQAFDLLDRRRYDIIFLDVVLPGVDGYRICKTIKKNGATKETPVIMLTSKSSPFDRVRGTFAGCDTYLTKPVSQDSFQKVVRKYLA